MSKQTSNERPLIHIKRYGFLFAITCYMAIIRPTLIMMMIMRWWRWCIAFCFVFFSWAISQRTGSMRNYGVFWLGNGQLWCVHFGMKDESAHNSTGITVWLIGDLWKPIYVLWVAEDWDWDLKTSLNFCCSLLSVIALKYIHNNKVVSVWIKVQIGPTDL